MPEIMIQERLLQPGLAAVYFLLLLQPLSVHSSEFKIVNMQKILIKKLHEYIRENNPDLLLQLEEESKVTEYLEKKVSTVNNLLQQYRGQPEYIIEEVC